MATVATWLRAAFPFGPKPHVATTATRESGALRFAACVFAVLLVDIAVELMVVRLSADPAPALLRATRALSWLFLLCELWLAAGVADLVLLLYKGVADHERACPIMTSRALGYSASAWALFVIPLGWLLSLLPEGADVISKYAHVPFLAAQLVPLDLSMRSDPERKAPAPIFLLCCLTFGSLNKLVDGWLREFYALLAG